MQEYRIFFFDQDEHIQARHEFAARHDADALWMTTLLTGACGDEHHGWGLWCGSRQVSESRASDRQDIRSRLAVLNEEQQRRLLDQEELLQSSRFRIAQSRELAALCDEVKESCLGRH
jgi:hypothetical protein